MRPRPGTYLPRALRHCTIRPTDVFVEFGSGKGRVIWQAARRPFARVVGVERFPELNAIARRNIEHNRERLVCRHVELITADATEFRVPDDMTFAYFYNPFKGATLERVIDNIVASLDRQPRKLMLIYAYPAADECILQTGRFELVRVIKGHRPDRGLKNRVNIYASASRSANRIPPAQEANAALFKKYEPTPSETRWYHGGDLMPRLAPQNAAVAGKSA
jgi:tRNA1(Val) A37 N6-methylase TrmN6